MSYHIPRNVYRVLFLVDPEIIDYITRQPVTKKDVAKTIGAKALKTPRRSRKKTLPGIKARWIKRREELRAKSLKQEQSDNMDLDDIKSTGRPLGPQDLPQEVRDLLFGVLFSGKVFYFQGSNSGLRSSRRTNSIITTLSLVSKQFAAYEDVVDAMLRNAKIKVDSIADAQNIGSSLTEDQKAVMKTLATTPNFVQEVEASINNTFSRTIPSNHILANLKIGNFHVDIASQSLELYLSVSGSSSFAMLANATAGTLAASVDLDADIREGHVSKVEAESMILESCIKDVTENRAERQLNSTGAFLGYAAKHRIFFRTAVNITLIERSSRAVLAKINGKFSTRDWCVRVPVGGNQLLKIDQTLSKDCFTMQRRDVRDLLAWQMPRRYAVLLDVGQGGNGHMDGNHWMYQYQSMAVAPYQQH